jgi:hypothetical protein
MRTGCDIPADTGCCEEHHPSHCLYKRHHQCSLRAGSLQDHHHGQHWAEQLPHVRVCVHACCTMHPAGQQHSSAHVCSCTTAARMCAHAQQLLRCSLYCSHKRQKGVQALHGVFGWQYHCAAPALTKRCVESNRQLASGHVHCTCFLCHIVGHNIHYHLHLGLENRTCVYQHSHVFVRLVLCWSSCKQRCLEDA